MRLRHKIGIRYFVFRSLYCGHWPLSPLFSLTNIFTVIVRSHSPSTYSYLYSFPFHFYSSLTFVVVLVTVNTCSSSFVCLFWPLATTSPLPLILLNKFIRHRYSTSFFFSLLLQPSHKTTLYQIGSRHTSRI